MTPDQEGIVQSMLYELAAFLTFDGWVALHRDVMNGRYETPSRIAPEGSAVPPAERP